MTPQKPAGYTAANKLVTPPRPPRYTAFFTTLRPATTTRRRENHLAPVVRTGEIPFKCASQPCNTALKQKLYLGIAHHLAVPPGLHIPLSVYRALPRLDSRASHRSVDSREPGLMLLLRDNPSLSTRLAHNLSLSRPTAELLPQSRIAAKHPPDSTPFCAPGPSPSRSAPEDSPQMRRTAFTR